MTVNATASSQKIPAFTQVATAQVKASLHATQTIPPFNKNVLALPIPPIPAFGQVATLAVAQSYASPTGATSTITPSGATTTISG